jgi:hypothetical protein
MCRSRLVFKDFPPFLPYINQSTNFQMNAIISLRFLDCPTPNDGLQGRSGCDIPGDLIGV